MEEKSVRMLLPVTRASPRLVFHPLSGVLAQFPLIAVVRPAREPMVTHRSS